MITVTKPFLPPQEDYQKYLDGIWKRQWLTNNGPLVNDLELKLKDFLNVPHLLFMGNGTIALQIAIKALELKGEIITTPFSYVATASSIVWEGCTPIFVDIDPGSLNIDVRKIESAITKNTSAILATHVYGNPVDVDAIEKISKKHNLKVIYDAAHCFGTRYKGKSVYTYGDISTTSFHATKLFHTIEGGAVFSGNPMLIKKMALMRNFGHSGVDDFAEVGINGKNSEFHAAMGLCVLGHIEAILRSRKDQAARYDYWLGRSALKKVSINPNADYNYAYYTVICPDEATTLKLFTTLEGNLIMPRRYFYPSLNSTTPYRSAPLEVSDDIARRVLCLPVYYDLTMEEIDYISRIILRVLNN